MKTFNEFMVNKHINPKVEEAAKLIVELELDPWDCVVEWAKGRNPEWEIRLTEKRVILEQGLWQGLKAGAQQAWQGLKAGAQQVHQSVAGPEAKYNQAITALTNLVQVMSQVPGVEAMKGVNGGPLVNELQGMINQMDQQKEMIPQLVAQQAQNTMQQQGTPNAPAGAPAGAPGVIPMNQGAGQAATA